MGFHIWFKNFIFLSSTCDKSLFIIKLSQQCSLEPMRVWGFTSSTQHIWQDLINCSCIRSCSCWPQICLTDSSGMLVKGSRQRHWLLSHVSASILLSLVLATGQGPDSGGKIWSFEKSFKKSFHLSSTWLIKGYDFSKDQIFPSKLGPRALGNSTGLSVMTLTALPCLTFALRN